MQSWTDVFLTKPAFLGLSVHKDSVTAIFHHLCVTVASGSYCLAFWAYLAIRFLTSGCFSTSNGCNCRNSVLITLVRADWGVYTLASHPIYQYSCLIPFVLVWVMSNSTNIKCPWRQHKTDINERRNKSPCYTVVFLGKSISINCLNWVCISAKKNL